VIVYGGFTGTDCEALLTESATALHFYTLLDGLMAIGHSAVLELPANVVHKVFRALKFSLLSNEVMSAPLALPPLPTHSTHAASHSTNAFHLRPHIPQIQLGNPLAALALHSSSFVVQRSQPSPRRAPHSSATRARSTMTGSWSTRRPSWSTSMPHTAVTQCVCRQHI
jgi:hypothetical protein